MRSYVALLLFITIKVWVWKTFNGNFWLYSGRNIPGQAHVCEIGQERDNGIWKWVLPYAEPCDCINVWFGGVNTKTPIRPFKPLYKSKLLVSTDVGKIRHHYGLQGKGKKKGIIFDTLLTLIWNI